MFYQYLPEGYLILKHPFIYSFDSTCRASLQTPGLPESLKMNDWYKVILEGIIDIDRHQEMRYNEAKMLRRIN
jgi:hypothetical protein